MHKWALSIKHIMLNVFALQPLYEKETIKGEMMDTNTIIIIIINDDKLHV